MLIEGRDRPPTILCGHTRPYYQRFMERFGFQPARADSLAFAIEMAEDSPVRKRLSRLADGIRRRREITVRGANLADWDGEIDRVHRLLEAALSHLPDHIGWHREALEALVARGRAR